MRTLTKWSARILAVILLLVATLSGYMEYGIWRAQSVQPDSNARVDFVTIGPRRPEIGIAISVSCFLGAIGFWALQRRMGQRDTDS